MNPGNKISVLIFDDESINLTETSSALSQDNDIETVGHAANEHDLYSLTNSRKPNVILFTPTALGSDPFILIAWITQIHPGIKVILVASAERSDHLARAMDAGAVGYIHKDELVDILANAVHRAARGDILFTTTQYELAQKWKQDVGHKLSQLTPREFEILILLAKGRGNQEIAQSLGISAKTAAYHVSNLLSKLQVKSRQEAAVWAVKHLSDNLE